MTIDVHRRHLILGAGFIALLAATWTFSRERSDHLAETLEKSVPPSAEISPESAPGPAGKARPKRIALTFDDGPHPVYTERLLRILRNYRVPATFFVVGKQAELHPGLLKKISREGHLIANHTFHHPDLRRLSDSEIVRELDSTRDTVRSLTGRTAVYFRPPGGRTNDRVERVAEAAGYRMTLWTVLPRDHARPPAKTIRDRVLRSARENGIVLLHSGVENTLRALPGVILALRKNGFEFVPVSDLAPDRVSPEDPGRPPDRPIEPGGTVPSPAAVPAPESGRGE
ncbi:MAG: hypothetical protein A2636_04225 [Elusimicrobia bacterium RIFCSPHIGHO2_01_FULL_64_10]|nr:MAG: hypothetical protein A2636_04225 [Elusimicrobia bacterium RIFCSPHIGHO2_01_FULL_64_10]